MVRRSGFGRAAGLGAAVWLLGVVAPAWASDPAPAGRDTVVVLGGPDRWDGRFETADGQPSWHGWTHVDRSALADTLWRVSTFGAEPLGGHGPGNHAMWCGRDFGGGRAGYGNQWSAELRWSRPVADPQAASLVVVQAFLGHDTEPGFDRVSFQVRRAGDAWQELRAYEGWRVNRPVDLSFTVAPGDYGGPAGDEIQLRWVFASDAMWSDEDDLYPTDGACRLDDVSVSVDGALATFDDFEPGADPAWRPHVPGVGDFAHLASGLDDLDPCRENASWQVCFVDDGEVVPGTGGSSCLQWCYGPGGHVLNATGGVLGGDGRLDNAVVSPVLAWPEGCDQAQLAFDVWRHEPLLGDTPGMVYRWRVRSTAQEDPAALLAAPWRRHDDVLIGGAGYVRHHELLGDLLEPGRRWFQVELGVAQEGWRWGLEGDDATPAPYFDNVAVKAFPVAGPQILVRDGDLPQDTFPANGALNLADLGANSCRFDMARNVSVPPQFGNDPGDSVVATVSRLRAGGFWAVSPKLVVRLRCNPLFDPYRIVAPPAGQSYLQFEAAGDSCRGPDGRAVRDRWWFDLPDERLIFPGDLLHFRIEAGEFAGGQIAMAHWPADTTGFSDLGPASPYPVQATMRALPSVHDATGAQPATLVWRDFATGDSGRAWDLALANLGLHRGSEYDLFVTRDPEAGLGNGLGGRATAAQLVGYRALLHGAGDHERSTLSPGDPRIDPSLDLAVLTQWQQQSHGQLLLTGDNTLASLVGRGAAADAFLAHHAGVAVAGGTLAPHVGGQSSPGALTIDGNPVLQDVAAWRLAGGCPDRRSFDALLPATGAMRLAEFTDRHGAGGVYGVAAAVLRVGPADQFRTVTLPAALAAIVDEPGENDTGVPISARARLLGDVLAYFGADFGAPTAVPAAPALAVRCFPNPFNPATTVVFDLPRAGRARLSVYDVRGRLVRVLVDEPRPAGRSSVSWDGTDHRGRAVASGVYVHEVVAGGEVRRGKMTLLK